MQEKRRMRTSTEMYPIVEKWQSSGQGKERFAKKLGIPYGTFQYWCSHYHSGNGGKALPVREPVSLAHGPAFVPLQVQEEESVSATTVVIVLPSGTRIEVR